MRNIRVIIYSGTKFYLPRWLSIWADQLLGGRVPWASRFMSESPEKCSVEGGIEGIDGIGDRWPWQHKGERKWMLPHLSNMPSTVQETTLTDRFNNKSETWEDAEKLQSLLFYVRNPHPLLELKTMTNIRTKGRRSSKEVLSQGSW
jgi:hypothetical protein